MRIPLSWLEEFIEVKASPEEVAEIFTLGGVEVGCIENPYEELGEVIAVKVLTVKEVPELKNLKVCVVTDGKSNYQVLTGAKGVKEGLVLAFAKKGALTFAGEKIEEKVVKGFKSEGAFLSPYEAGISEKKDELLVLPPDAEPGKKVWDALGVKEFVLELEITPNRGDVLSILGAARELHALTSWELKEPTFEEYLFAGKNCEVNIKVEDTDGCYRYAGRSFDGIKVKESPFWIQKRLWMCGLSPINNVVDITNYVMLELGQPLHAFDLEKIQGKTVVVRKAKEGEELLLLDGTKVKLSKEDLVIADATRPMVLAGIMGGEESGVSESTTKVFLEAAWFNPKRIRMSSKLHNISTDSSYRFERGIDPEGITTAILRASELLIEVCGAKGFSEVKDVYPKPYRAPLISLSQKKLVKYLGFSIPSQEVEKLLSRIGQVRRLGENFEVIPFSYRQDLRIEEDLIEEVARIYGYEKIPTTYPKGLLLSKGGAPEFTFEKKLKDIFVGLGLFEVITYSFISPEFPEKLRLPESDERRRVIKLSNPIAKTQSVLRTTLIPGLLEVAKFNSFREVDSLRVFEVGKVFFPDEVSDTKAREVSSLGLLLMGYREKDVWYTDPVKFDIFDLKGILEELFEVLKLDLELSPYSGEPFLKRGKSFDILYKGRKVGFGGEVKDLILKNYDLKLPVFVAEIRFTEDLIQGCGKAVVVKKPPKFPSTFRDVTCIMDKGIKVGEVIEFVKSLEVPFLEEVKCVKVYEGHPIPKGKKSVSFRFWYRAEDRTLKDEEVNEIQERVAREIFEKFNAVPR